VIKAGSMTYQSKQAPVPLTALDEALLINVVAERG